jgi:hypothetical protein
MALKGSVTDIEEVPEGLREHYKQDGAAWVLDVPDLAPKTRINEFRDKNIGLQRKLDEMNASFEGVDIEEYKALKTRSQKEHDKKLLDAGKVEEMFAERLNPIKAEKEKTEKELRSQLADKDSRLAKFMIDNEIRSVAMKSGVHPTAVDDLILRGHQIFKMDGDKVTPRNGDQVIFGKSGDPLGFEEWVEGLVEKAPHLFQSSQGGGAPKAGSSSAPSAGRIAADDHASFLANLSDIASGKKKIG